MKTFIRLGISMKGRKITGFFGFFDILGYKNLIENNELNDLIQIFDEIILNVEKEAVTISGLDKEQMFIFQPKVETRVFSDTIILYQTEPKQLFFPTAPSVLLKSSLLLRFAFERGIPIRGAISYGEYYIHENRFLGKPILETHEEERSQKWSGAILCKSAEEKIETLLEGANNKYINFRGINMNPKSWLKYSLEHILHRYSVPMKKGRTLRLALCWGDFVMDFLGLHDIEELNHKKSKEYISKRVKKKFKSHGKSINNEVKEKICNTVEFLYKIKSRPVTHSRLQYIPKY